VAAAKQVVGLKLGAASVRAACLAVDGSAELLHVAEGPLPSGAVAGGEVRDEAALAAALADFFKRNKLPRRNVRLGVANNRIGVRTIDVAGIEDPQQLANAVRFRAQEALPIPLDQAVLDFQVVSEGVDAQGAPSKRILLVVAYRDLIDAYTRVCRQAGLRLVGVDLEAFALLRALAPGVKTAAAERSALVAVSIGADRTVLAVSDGETCDFTRVLEWGGNALTGALAASLGLEPEEVERVKTSLALDDESVPDGLSPEQATQGRAALRQGLQAFGRELISSLQFYQGQPDSLGIREVVIAGGTARLRGLAGQLESLVGVPVRVGDPLVGVAVGKKLKSGVPDAAHTVAIGLGMGI
jgi:type IV pilus assembly protein PilM